MGLPAELFGGRGAGEVAESLRCCGRFSPCRWQTRADLCNLETFLIFMAFFTVGEGSKMNGFTVL